MREMQEKCDMWGKLEELKTKTPVKICTKCWNERKEEFEALMKLY
jgi:hypothetical protein